MYFSIQSLFVVVVVNFETLWCRLGLNSWHTSCLSFPFVVITSERLFNVSRFDLLGVVKSQWECFAFARDARIYLSLCLLLPASRFTLYEVLLAQTEGEMCWKPRFTSDQSVNKSHTKSSPPRFSFKWSAWPMSKRESLNAEWLNGRHWLVCNPKTITSPSGCTARHALLPTLTSNYFP